MIAYVAVLPTPYFQVTARDGRAMLKDLPPGKYTVQAWHPSLKGTPEQLAQHIDVGQGTAQDLVFCLGLEAGFSCQARSRLNHRRISLKFRFRSFRSRLLFFLVALLTLLQSATYLVVRQANRRHALTQIESSLRAGGRIFEKLIEQRNQADRRRGSDSFARSRVSRSLRRCRTRIARQRYRHSKVSAAVSADVILIASLEKKLIFDTRRPKLHDVPFPFPKLIAKAETNETAYEFVVLDNELYAMAVNAVARTGSNRVALLRFSHRR